MLLITFIAAFMLLSNLCLSRARFEPELATLLLLQHVAYSYSA